MIAPKSHMRKSCRDEAPELTSLVKQSRLQCATAWQRRRSSRRLQTALAIAGRRGIHQKIHLLIAETGASRQSALLLALPAGIAGTAP